MHPVILARTASHVIGYLMSKKWPLGVFASVDAGLGIRLEVLHELGVPTIQVHAPTRQRRSAAQARDYRQRLDAGGIRVTAVFGGFAGESYADIPSVAATVGFVPPATRDARVTEMKEISDFAAQLGVDVIALHVGCIPHRADDAEYASIVAATREVCEHAQRNGQSLHLETGQETALALLDFHQAVDLDNLFVNFDPANMILYGTGDPIEALRSLGGLVRSVHCKDARWAARPGEEWGTETPLGEGDVNMEMYLRTLAEIGYIGPLTVEREIPRDPIRQKEEIGHAIRLLEELKQKFP